MTETNEHKSEQSIYDKLGGKKGVNLFVEQLYFELVKDEMTAPFFSGIMVKDIMLRHGEMIVAALGGPPFHGDVDLTQAHAKLVERKGLSDVHVDKLKELVKLTADRCGFDDDVYEALDSYIEQRRNTVLGR